MTMCSGLTGINKNWMRYLFSISSSRQSSASTISVSSSFSSSILVDTFSSILFSCSIFVSNVCRTTCNLWRFAGFVSLSFHQSFSFVPRVSLWLVLAEHVVLSSTVLDHPSWSRQQCLVRRLSVSRVVSLRRSRTVSGGSFLLRMMAPCQQNLISGMMDDLHGDFINFYKRSKNDVVSTGTLVTIYILMRYILRFIWIQLMT